MIKFRKVRYKNFLSTGNEFTEIDLSRKKTSLIIGANGSGKSTLLMNIDFLIKANLIINPAKKIYF